MKFRKKPVVVEAVQFNGKNHLEICGFAGRDLPGSLAGSYLTIPTSEGYMQAFPGDWIIKGVKGELYPCKPDIFDLTYEAVLA